MRLDCVVGGCGDEWSGACNELLAGGLNHLQHHREAPIALQCAGMIDDRGPGEGPAPSAEPCSARLQVDGRAQPSTIAAKK